MNVQGLKIKSLSTTNKIIAKNQRNQFFFYKQHLVFKFAFKFMTKKIPQIPGQSLLFMALFLHS